MTSRENLMKGELKVKLLRSLKGHITRIESHEGRIESRSRQVVSLRGDRESHEGRIERHQH